MAEMENEVAALRTKVAELEAENARLKETPEPSSQDLMEYPLEVKVEAEPEVKVAADRRRLLGRRLRRVALLPLAG